MSLRSQDYAELSEHGYQSPGADYPAEHLEAERPIEIGGVAYKVLEHVDSPSGYQGTIYQRIDTGEIVVAHRGTEPLGKNWQDTAIDATMAVKRVNLQAEDAIALTKIALAYARANDDGYDPPPEVTVTGHSLGGCLAQITAHHFGLRGETFNPYGAVSLNYRIPEGGHQVINHVMAGDVVSAASPHYGQMRVYATRQEIDVLTNSGYQNDRSILNKRDNVGAIRQLLDSHSLHSFRDVDGNGNPDRSVLNDPQAPLLAQRFDPMIDRYRNDVRIARTGLTMGARGVPGMLNDTVDYIRGPLEPGEPALREQRRQPPVENPEHRLPKHQVDQFMQTPGAFLGRSLSMAEPAAPPQAQLPVIPEHLHDFRHEDHPRHVGYERFMQALQEQPIGSVTPDQHERLAAALTAVQGTAPFFPEVDRLLLDENGILWAGDRPRSLINETPDWVSVDLATALARTPEQGAEYWRERHVPAPTPHLTQTPTPTFDPQQLTPADLRHPDHPRHGLFAQTRDLLGTEYYRWGMPHDPAQLDREAAQMVVEARRQRIDEVDRITLSFPPGGSPDRPMMSLVDSFGGEFANRVTLDADQRAQAPQVDQASTQLQQVENQVALMLLERQAQHEREQSQSLGRTI